MVTIHKRLTHISDAAHDTHLVDIATSYGLPKFAPHNRTQPGSQLHGNRIVLLEPP